MDSHADYALQLALLSHPLMGPKQPQGPFAWPEMPINQTLLLLQRRPCLQVHF